MENRDIDVCRGERVLFQSLKDARRCAFLGELDSVEESDEISDEFEFSDEWSDEIHDAVDREEYPTAAAGSKAARPRAREEAVTTDGSSSGEMTFRHHRASLNAMSKVRPVPRMERNGQ